jgi:biopolymer transport protein ExbD
MLVILLFFMMSIMFTKHSRFADLQKKLEVVKRKIEVSYRFGFSKYEQFCPDS